jgi:hypothetical protein
VVNQLHRVHQVHVDNRTTRPVEVELLNAFERETRREGPIRHEESHTDTVAVAVDETLELLLAENFGELVPSHLTNNTHNCNYIGSISIFWSA